MTTQIKGNDTSTFGGNIDVTGNVVTDAPAFSAYANATQSLTNATWTKAQCNTEEFDTNANYDNATNYHFTPTVAGYYQINAGVTFNYTAAADKAFATYISKNGGVAKYTGRASSTGLLFPVATANCLIYLNGSTDSIAFYIYQNTGGSVSTVASSTDTYFQAHLARAV